MNKWYNIIAQLKKDGITVAEEVEDIGDGNKRVITDKGYSVNIIQEGERNVIIEIEGIAGKLPPRVTKIDLSKENANIKINIEVKRAEGATYKYYYIYVKRE